MCVWCIFVWSGTTLLLVMICVVTFTHVWSGYTIMCGLVQLCLSGLLLCGLVVPSVWSGTVVCGLVHVGSGGALRRGARPPRVLPVADERHRRRVDCTVLHHTQHHRSNRHQPPQSRTSVQFSSVGEFMFTRSYR